MIKLNIGPMIESKQTHVNVKFYYVTDSFLWQPSLMINFIDGISIIMNDFVGVSLVN